jgi:hypothetical protein
MSQFPDEAWGYTGPQGEPGEPGEFVPPFEIVLSCRPVTNDTRGAVRMDVLHRDTQQYICVGFAGEGTSTRLEPTSVIHNGYQLVDAYIVADWDDTVRHWDASWSMSLRCMEANDHHDAGEVHILHESVHLSLEPADRPAFEDLEPVEDDHEQTRTGSRTVDFDEYEVTEGDILRHMQENRGVEYIQIQAPSILVERARTRWRQATNGQLFDDSFRLTIGGVPVQADSSLRDNQASFDYLRPTSGFTRDTEPLDVHVDDIREELAAVAARDLQEEIDRGVLDNLNATRALTIPDELDGMDMSTMEAMAAVHARAWDRRVYRKRRRTLALLLILPFIVYRVAWRLKDIFCYIFYIGYEISQLGAHPKEGWHVPPRSFSDWLDYFTPTWRLVSTQAATSNPFMSQPDPATDMTALVAHRKASFVTAAEEFRRDLSEMFYMQGGGVAEQARDCFAAYNTWSRMVERDLDIENPSDDLLSSIATSWGNMLRVVQEYSDYTHDGTDNFRALQYQCEHIIHEFARFIDLGFSTPEIIPAMTARLRTPLPHTTPQPTQRTRTGTGQDDAEDTNSTSSSETDLQRRSSSERSLTVGEPQQRRVRPLDFRRQEDN